ncbi:hypothetical protein OHA10_19290 [Kribbella sp. NBC_00662]|uniref:hypothetical protein n=1 Tax=Kribbella sp. NBC_00662 TaxID=2975969 RepID=UPI003249B407
MSEDLSLPDRASVRTPMQWSAADNAGFSKAPLGLVEPAPIASGPYAFTTVNVAEQELRPGSLLSRVSQLATTRRGLGVLPSGSCEGIAVEPRSVFGVLHRRRDDAVLMLANLSPDEVRVHLPYDVRADLLADSNYQPATEDLVLTGYGYRWLRVHDAS